MDVPQFFVDSFVKSFDMETNLLPFNYDKFCICIIRKYILNEYLKNIK